MGCRSQKLGTTHVEVVFKLEDVGLVVEMVGWGSLRASSYDFEGFILGGLEGVEMGSG